MRNDDLLAAIHAALAAGKVILDIYASGDFGIKTKSDNSPLTQADRAAHACIFERLSGTSYPLLSEEGRDIPHAERGSWPVFWLIDPLDGTREFIKRNGEFTVNIALIENGCPVLGAVYAPVLDTLYFAAKGAGAYKLGTASTYAGRPLDEMVAASCSLPCAQPEAGAYTIVGSRSHQTPEFAAFVSAREKEYERVAVRSIGSSLKICLVAEGSADVYPRLGPTMEWDTAAGHAVAACAGCAVVRVNTGEPLIYNKPDLLNPFFIVERR
ncbi:3'(2'),5'-bisphosphate nucleotidase CysQ [Desulfomicrobium sp. ZS1]|jgi:3'(2'), 5'-bisphosphate nucleotidase|uniref:3'(2'),5'-bisphosphate nucleotidase CysQ n=1 Tax=Desulfomicrobium sp. ZS1 TaxID=2952228 RepID=UPI0020B1F90B|nr:3'(2'),5'-bisphosphate nucleotidase CysQ [Desulfomicrobium sp. ZS1]UTF48902.1 3'(2'),5'-bisphosphate nucleotidase CysQ [Desulfomicrobium sp. ZS1]